MPSAISPGTASANARGVCVSSPCPGSALAALRGRRIPSGCPLVPPASGLVRRAAYTLTAPAQHALLRLCLGSSDPGSLEQAKNQLSIKNARTWRSCSDVGQPVFSTHGRPLLPRPLLGFVRVPFSRRGRRGKVRAWRRGRPCSLTVNGNTLQGARYVAARVGGGGAMQSNGAPGMARRARPGQRAAPGAHRYMNAAPLGPARPGTFSLTLISLGIRGRPA